MVQHIVCIVIRTQWQMYTVDHQHGYGGYTQGPVLSAFQVSTVEGGRVWDSSSWRPVQSTSAVRYRFGRPGGRFLWANNFEQANTDCHRPPEDTVPEPALFISLLTIELGIPWAQSLKDRRSAVRGLKDRLRSRFNASVAEVAFQDKWQRAILAVCIVDSDRRQLESSMARVRQLAEEAQEMQITGMRQEWL